jgi:hypothetical protein
VFAVIYTGMDAYEPYQKWRNGELWTKGFHVGPLRRMENKKVFAGNKIWSLERR